MKKERGIMTDSEKLDLLLSKVEKLDSIEKELQEVKIDVKSVKNEVTSLELHIENVTDKNIQTVAEGHLDLSRKLDDALKVENEKEMLIIKMRVLEDELRKVKARLDEIA